jgi:hypothetical protein
VENVYQGVCFANSVLTVVLGVDVDAAVSDAVSLISFNGEAPLG